LRHLAQWSRLPFTAVFGRTFFPVRGKFLAIGTSIRHNLYAFRHPLIFRLRLGENVGIS
jgi:hypothetical protein